MVLLAALPGPAATSAAYAGGCLRLAVGFRTLTVLLPDFKIGSSWNLKIEECISIITAIGTSDTVGPGDYSQQ